MTTDVSATWDVFHGDRLEVERNLNAEAVRRGLADGSIREDDLIRPGGSSQPWSPLVDHPDFAGAGAGSLPSASTPPAEFARFVDDDDGLEMLDDVKSSDSALVPLETAPSAASTPLMAEIVPEDEPGSPLGFEFVGGSSTGPDIILPPAPHNPIPPWDQGDDDENDAFDPLEEDEEAAEFTLSRSGPDTIEELDLAAMVDVAFQLVLFFLVTATTVLYKSLEVPKPNADAPPAAATQGRSKSLDDFKSDFILVEIDAAGAMKLDHEPLPEAMTLQILADRLRTARKDTDRQAILLSADFTTPHKKAVLAYDAANEIGLRIAIAKPTGNPNATDGKFPPNPVK